MSESLETSHLHVAAVKRDIRRDLHRYVQYMAEHTIKRTYRENTLPKGEVGKLARVLATGKDELALLEESGWIEFVDRLALKLGLVRYKTGERRYGYYVETSFHDNYVEVGESYTTFLKLPLLAQEQTLLAALIKDYSHLDNEFYQPSLVGQMDPFPSWGSAMGLMPSLNFAEIRGWLFHFLQQYQPGVWYSTAVFIQRLKDQAPYFLIPENAPTQKSRPNEGRYGNFYEGADYYTGKRESISPGLPDAFERVEGRYVERFLEGIPLLLGYVEVAYGEPSESTKPALGMLQAFRLQERFFQVMQGRVPEPRVTVQPNFEIYIESLFYPARIMQQLLPLTSLMAEGTTTVLKLQRQKVAAVVAQQPELDVLALLQQLPRQPLPQNVAIEVTEWVGHAEAFTLYSGFGLVEGTVQVPEGLGMESLAAQIHLVRDAHQVFQALRNANQVPLHVRHTDEALQVLPKKVKTVFLRENTLKREKLEVTLRQRVQITITVPERTLLERLRKAMLDAQCRVETNWGEQTLTFAKRDETHFKAALKSLQAEYKFRLEEGEP